MLTFHCFWHVNYSLPLINRWRSWSDNVLSFLTTNAFGTSPDSGSEIPITPTSATLSWRNKSSSSSAGATLKSKQVSQKCVKLFWYDDNTNSCDFTHLESFHFDELLYSIDDVNKSFVIVITDISSVQPTFCVNSLGSRPWILVVTFHNLGMTRGFLQIHSNNFLFSIEFITSLMWTRFLLLCLQRFVEEHCLFIGLAA